MFTVFRFETEEGWGAFSGSDAANLYDSNSKLNDFCGDNCPLPGSDYQAYLGRYPKAIFGFPTLASVFMTFRCPAGRDAMRADGCNLYVFKVEQLIHHTEEQCIFLRNKAVRGEKLLI